MKLFYNGQEVRAIPAEAGGRLVCLLREDEAPNAEGIPWLTELAALDEHESASTHYESHEGFDFVCILVPDMTDPAPDTAGLEAEPCRLRACLGPDSLTVVHSGLPVVEALAKKLAGGQEIWPEHALYLIFSLLTQHDAAKLEDIEDEIADLEEQMTSGSPPKEGVAAISALRRRLLVLKRYYEGLFDALEDIEENPGCLLSKEQVRAFRLQTNRADRLSRAVQSLREYVTSVREAYQNQLDISLNKTMKLFTVLTAIFLPLQLIAGWYGMNLIMPEYAMEWAYPLVIVVSLVLIVGIVLYFKRNKWF